MGIPHKIVKIQKSKGGIFKITPKCVHNLVKNNQKSIEKDLSNGNLSIIWTIW